jgi:hypothetical protein
MLLPCGRENPKYRDQSWLCLDYTFLPCGRENPKYRDQNQLRSDYTLSPFGRENPKYRDQTHRKQLRPKLWVCRWTWSLAPQVLETNFVSQYARRGQSSKERDPQKRERVVLLALTQSEQLLHKQQQATAENNRNLTVHHWRPDQHIHNGQHFASKR